MRRILILAAVATLAVGLVPVAHAQQTNDDPSLDGTTGLFVVPRAGTVQQGEFSLGVALDQLAFEEGDTIVRRLAVVGAYGLTERLEIYARIEPFVDIDRDFTSELALFRMHPRIDGTGLNRHPFLLGNEADGVGTFTVGAKYKLAGDPYEYNGLALGGFVNLPTSDDTGGIGTGNFDLGAYLAASLEAWDAVGWNGYLGFTFKDDVDVVDQLGGPPVRGVFGEQFVLPVDNFFVSNELVYGIGAEFPNHSPLRVILEGYGIVTTEDVTAAYIGGDDVAVLQGGLRYTHDSGFALGAAANYNLTIDVRDPDWQEDAQAIDDNLRRIGFVAMSSYSSSRRLPLSYVGTSPMALPPVNRPPTLECRAERTTLRVGESVRLIATTDDPDNDPVTVLWSASAGTLSPNEGTEVTWSTEGVAPGTGPISARAADGYGGTAECTVRVTVEAPPPPPEPTVLTFECDEFRSGSARIDNRCKAILDDVALQLRQNPGATAAVTGHSDSAGSADANMTMSQERADNAKAYLVETHGIDPSRITTEGVGSTEPAADNSTRAGRAQNRRVEITVTIPPQ